MNPLPPPSSAGSMPLGIRVTTLFLRVMVVALIFPVMGGAFASLGYLALIFGSHASPLNTLLLPLFGFGFFLAVLATAMGCEWMIRFLRARHSRPEVLPRPVLPPHPAVQIGLPLVRIVGIYSTLALLAWLVALIGSSTRINWAWLVFWLVTGVTSHVAIKRLNAWSSEKDNPSQA